MRLPCKNPTLAPKTSILYDTYMPVRRTEITFVTDTIS